MVRTHDDDGRYIEFGLNAQQIAQLSRDTVRFGPDYALVLCVIRRKPTSGLWTLREVAEVCDLSERDTLDIVEDLVRARRLEWSVIGGTDRMTSRVRAAQ